MKKSIKIFVLNILIFLGLVIALEFGLSLMVDAHHFYHASKRGETIDKRAFLPNYKNIDWAKTHFKELYKNTVVEYRSYYGWRRKPVSGETININDSGIRKTVQHKDADDSSLLAIFLGGSTIWGLGAADEYTIPSFFAKSSSKTYRVLNYGESGYSAYQGFLFLQYKIIEGVKPALVISFDGVNNSPAHLPRKFAHSREQQIVERTKGADDGSDFQAFTLRATREVASKIKNLIGGSASETTPEIASFSKETNERAARELLESWLLTKKLSDSVGARFICILQPNTFVGNPNVKTIAESLENDRYKSGYEYYKDVLELLNSDKYKVLKPHFLDLTGALDKMPDTYIDFCHVSPGGNEKLASLIVSGLEDKKQNETK